MEAIKTATVEGLEVSPGGEDFFVGGGLAELDADALGVAIDYCYAVAVRGESEGRGLEAGVGCGAEELGYFFLELLFFVLDVGDDVAEDVEGGYARIAGAETACRVETKSFSMPKRVSSGASGSTRPMAQQLGLVTM